MSPPRPLVGGRRDGAILRPATQRVQIPHRSVGCPAATRVLAPSRRSANRCGTPSGHPGFESRRWADAHRNCRFEGRDRYRPSSPDTRVGGFPIPQAATVEQERYFACHAGVPGSIPGRRRRVFRPSRTRGVRSVPARCRVTAAPDRPKTKAAGRGHRARRGLVPGHPIAPAIFRSPFRRSSPCAVGSATRRLSSRVSQVRSLPGTSAVRGPASGDPTLRGRPLRLR